MISNSDLSTSEDLSYHFRTLTFLAADRKEVFDFAQKKLVGESDGFDMLTKGVKAVTDSWKSIVDAFKTISTSTVK